MLDRLLDKRKFIDQDRQLMTRFQDELDEEEVRLVKSV